MKLVAAKQPKQEPFHETPFNFPLERGKTVEATNHLLSTPAFGQLSFKTSHKCDMLPTDISQVN